MLRDDVLRLLEASPGRQATGGRMAQALGASRTAVWKAIHRLIEEGHRIEILPNSGYRLAEDSDGLSLGRIVEALAAPIFGKRLELLPSVDSTNDYIKRRDPASLPEGYVVVADAQTAGRGRLNRRFFSLPHQGIYMSLLLKPGLPLAETPFLTLVAAVAVAEAVEAVCPMRVGIKWVNDLFYQGKKLCGILTEAGVTGETATLEYAVVGIGVNTGDIAPEVADIAVSTAASGCRGVRNRLIAEILNRFEPLYRGAGDPDAKQAVLDAYARRLFILGRRIAVHLPGGAFQGVAAGVDTAGALLVTADDGTQRAVRSGEISLLQEV